MSGQRLCNLLNDILDAASLNNRSLRLVDEDVPLAAVCEHVMHLTKAVLKKVRGPSLARPPRPPRSELPAPHQYRVCAIALIYKHVTLSTRQSPNILFCGREYIHNIGATHAV